MNKKIFSILACASALVSTSAMAQNVTGTVTITGSVAPKCLVVPGNGNTFGATVALGELSDVNGQLRTNLANSFTGANTIKARVVCTSANPTISVDANEIKAATATAVAGYANRIDFEASVAVTTTGTSPAPFTNDSASPAGTDTVIGGGRLANNGSDNIAITAGNFRTGALSGTATDLLAADTTYTGSIVVVIKPGA
jgi:hypothetical protein